MKIFLTGKNGQLGNRLDKDLKKIHDVIATDRNTLDLVDTQFIKDTIYKVKPDLIINAAAYTNVDQAEKEKDLAYKINALAPKALSQAAKALDIPIIHISTDYVFDGTKEGAYLEDDQVNPLSVYGITKWHGEEFVRQHPKHFILRTSWVFSCHGHNFLKKIIKLAQEKNSLSVVDDQWGSPTSVKTLSDSIQAIIHKLQIKNNLDIYGTYHITSEGETNWYLYASQILDILEFSKVKLKLVACNVHPITSSRYPQDARRPKNSRMNTTKFRNVFMLTFPHWKNELKDIAFPIIKGLNK
jgi:dTDP-4-dehydrorhamnose reductase